MAATKCREIDLEQNVAARFSEVDQMSMPHCIYFEKSACFHHKKTFDLVDGNMHVMCTRMMDLFYLIFFIQ